MERTTPAIEICRHDGYAISSAAKMMRPPRCRSPPGSRNGRDRESLDNGNDSGMMLSARASGGNGRRIGLKSAAPKSQRGRLIALPTNRLPPLPQILPFLTPILPL